MLEMPVSRAAAGCGNNDWLLADDSRQYGIFVVPSCLSEPAPLVRLDGVLNEIVGFKEGQIQDFISRPSSSRARRGSAQRWVSPAYRKLGDG